MIKTIGGVYPISLNTQKVAHLHTGTSRVFFREVGGGGGILESVFFG